MKQASILFFLILILTISCNKNETKNEEIVEIISEEPEIDSRPKAGTVEFLNQEKVDNNYILVNDAGANRVYLMDKNSTIVYEWTLTKGIGNDVVLLPDGNLLAILQADDPSIEFGGQGGIIQIINKDGDILWNFEHSTADYITHHDVELLPNGNVLTMVWEKMPLQDAVDSGSKVAIDLYPEAIIEIDPNTNEIVWEWHAKDHLIQDYDLNKANYGVIAENPQKIDLNYVSNDKGDIMHANGLSYDTAKDVIYLSVNFYSEVWVIDHSSSKEQAATSSGGNYNKGGDIIYRFGNPEAYGNIGTRLFRNNHFPNILKGSNLGKMLIFTNGAELLQSTVYELVLPSTFNLQAGVDNEPEVSWSFTDPDLYSPKVSGAVDLPNGNRLITEGDFGLWEVSDSGEVLWKFEGNGFYWRAYHYTKNAPEIIALELKK
tara:strand:+ start:6716 stop:8011 length:1296 start_codon:yes stop_codon:yes gene_type:complete